LINHKPAVHYTQAFLLGAGVLIEISIAMVLLSRILKVRGKSLGERHCRHILGCCSARIAIYQKADFGLCILLNHNDCHHGGYSMVCVEVV